MIASSASSLEQALTAISARRVMVLRGSRISVALPAGVTEVADASSAEAVVMSLDAASLDESAAHVASFPPDRIVAWALPLARAGVVTWALSRARRLQPIALEDACDALRHAGVVDVRVTTIAGTPSIALVTGRTTG